MMLYTFLRKNPNQVDPRTVRVLMEVAELHRRHLGGQLLFSPDGLLHIILGDGMITLDDMEEMDGLRWDHQLEDCTYKIECCMSESFLSLCHREGVFCLCVWMQWFHRVRPKGWCGHRLLHITLFYTKGQPILQQHQPATWNLCPWITWPWKVSEGFNGKPQQRYAEELTDWY